MFKYGYIESIVRYDGLLLGWDKYVLNNLLSKSLSSTWTIVIWDKDLDDISKFNAIYKCAGNKYRLNSKS